MNTTNQPTSVELGPVRTRSAPANVSFLDAWRQAHGPEARRQASTRAVVPRRAYSGAAWGRTMSDWVTLSTSSDAELYMGLRALRNRSRDLARNNEYALNAFRQITNNVVGGGVRFQAQVPMRRGNALDKATNDRIEAEWQRWCRAEFCHTAGRMSFSALERTVIRTAAINGEILVRKVKKAFAGSRVPFALELISPDQLVDQWSGYKPTQNEIRMGVEVDEWQRPVAYWLYPRHPGDNQILSGVTSNQYLRVPADEIIHVGLFQDAWQTRCVPWLHATIVKLRHMGGYEEAEIIAARGSAAIMGIVQSPEVDMPDPDSEDTDDVVDGEAVWDMSPGLVKKLGPGETFVGFNPSRPNSAMDPFMRYMLRSVAAGIGMSYEALSGDYSQSNYSSSRMALLPERDNWRILQRWLIETFHQRVYEAWLDQAVMYGALNLPAYELRPELYANVRWQPRGWDWVDPAKEIAAARSAIRAGLATNESVLAAKGEDYEDVFDARRRELDYAAELKLVLDTDPAQVNDKGAAQAAPAPDGGGDAGGAGAAPAQGQGQGDGDGSQDE
jgi:lambda family phage portal protein